MGVLQRLQQNSVDGEEVRPGLGKCRVSTYKATGKGSIQIHIGNKYVEVARAAWEAHNGPINDPSLLVCHKCDNPRCINPEHLFLGTHKENMRDMVQKNRASRKGNPGYARMLDKSLYPAIAADTRSQAAIATAYGVSERTIRRIINERV